MWWQSCKHHLRHRDASGAFCRQWPSLSAFEERSRGEDGRAWVHELGEVDIARDDALRIGLPSERDEIVVTGIGGQTRPRRRISDQHGVLDQARKEARHLATGGVLLFDCHPHRLFLAHARPRCTTVSQDRLDALAAAQQRQIARVGENNGLWATMGTDHHGIGVSPPCTKARKKRRQF
jgi:hypothetical protein